ncbi:Pyridoxal kinase [Abeliophyllum distichum]|uniref:pyridoxal kinase n=1 Tax=Abeliophyllum distichum TaxID=126358 RepID=A0ABD1SUE2_9LAMI
MDPYRLCQKFCSIILSGTGDLTSYLLLGWSNKYPDNLDKAAELAVSSLHDALLMIVALLVRTPNGYKIAGHDCESSSLEIPLIRSQNDIPNPEVKYSARQTTGVRIALFI